MELEARPPKQATEVRQAGLVAAALRLAAERTPADITTADLARAVGITQGAVFRHFASKETIWLAVLDWVAVTLLTRLQEAATGSGEQPQVFPEGQSEPCGGTARVPPPFHALQAMFTAHVDFVMEHPGVPRVIFQELQHTDDTPLKTRVRSLMQQYRMLVMGQLQHAQAQNLLVASTDLQAAAVLFLGAVQGLVMQAMVGGQIQSMAVQASAVFAIYLRGIARTTPPHLETTP
jgi:TetR/AcrR family transcriptional regulator